MSKAKIPCALVSTAFALSLLSGPRQGGAEELVYAISEGEIYAIEADGGQVHRIVTSDSGFQLFTQLAFDAAGRLHGIANAHSIVSIFTGVELYSFDLGTGHATLEIELSTGSPATGMTFDSEGVLWTAFGRTLTSRRDDEDFVTRTTLERTVTSLATRDGQVFATTFEEATRVHGIEQLDLDELRLLPLSTIDPGGAIITDATFDSQGQLRLAAVVADPFSLTWAFLLVTDLSSGELVETLRDRRPYVSGGEKVPDSGGHPHFWIEWPNSTRRTRVPPILACEAVRSCSGRTDDWFEGFFLGIEHARTLADSGWARQL